MNTLRTAQTVLSRYFGYSEFRTGQAPLIEHLLKGQDCLGVMPTGAGKSLCYQVPALLLDGVTLVISPLISLMKDQVEALRSCGIKAAYLNSSLSTREQSDTLQAVERGEVTLLYVAPERLEAPAFQNFAQRSGTGSVPAITLVAVDEAHCISQWGQDFRPSYTHIPRFVAQLPTRPIVAAFTATATQQVRDDISKLLQLRDPFILTTGFDRPNLHFEVQRPKVASSKTPHLLAFLRKQTKQNGEQSGIVYCSTRKAVEQVCQELVDAGFAATRYHAGLTEQERHDNQDDFLFDRKPIMVATNAFGMGIDKSNVNFVVHYNLPQNMEAYYQEAGRAGRDGTPAWCLLLYSSADVETNKFLITKSSRMPGISDDDQSGIDSALLRQELEVKDLALLKQMIFYATTDGCLRAFILRYFGEADVAPHCEMCSSCTGDFTQRDITLEARKIISCVYRMGERGQHFGKTMVVDVLRGSQSRRVLDAGLETLSTHGIMADVSARDAQRIIDVLIERDYLAISDSRYPVASLGTRYREALAEGAQLTMLEALSPVLGVADNAEQDADTGGTTRSQKPSSKQQKAEAVLLSDDDRRLFESLRALRRELADAEGVPAFVVFSDATLYDMVAKHPRSQEEFLEVSGVGAVKLDRYGKAFLEVLQG